MQVISRTHVGLVRENNEDALLVREPSLFAVADGMGGYAAGEIASRSTIKAFEAATHSLRHEQEEQNIRKVMLEAFDKANTHVYKMAVSNESYSGMGTTMTALYLPEDGHGYCCHVGDSRLYLFRNDKLEQLTHDHTLVADLKEQGKSRTRKPLYIRSAIFCCKPWVSRKQSMLISSASVCRRVTGCCCAATVCPTCCVQLKLAGLSAVPIRSRLRTNCWSRVWTTADAIMCP